ncbi:hypothetical protein ACKWTF_016627 [Chironomus riparius]
MNFLFLIIFWCFICRSLCANILAILAVPYYSHHIIHHQILQEFANRGHNLTIFTPYFMNYDSTNVTQHYLEGLVDTFHKYTNILDYKLKNMSNSEIYGFWEMRSAYKILEKVFENQEFQKLFKNRDNHHYDLIMTECLLCSPIVLAEIYDCPIVMLNAGESHVHQHQLLGNFAHPSIHPDIYVLPMLHGELSLISRINSFIIYKIFVGIWKFLTNTLSDYLLYSTFPNLSYKSQDEIIRKRMKIFLSFTSTLTTSIRPTVPIYHQIGFIHIKEPKEIKDKELVNFLDESKNGVIIISFGSVAGDLSDELLMKFLEVFLDLPYNVIWKTNVTKFRDMFRLNRMPKWNLIENLSENLMKSEIKSLECENSFRTVLNSVFFEKQCSTTKVTSFLHDQSFEVNQRSDNKNLQLKSFTPDNLVSNCSKCDRNLKEIFVPKLFFKNKSKIRQAKHKEPVKTDEHEIKIPTSNQQSIFKTKNILASNWLPLADILAHPNVKLLISHSGLRTIEEAIDREIPMILIPLSYDQPFNAILQSKHEVALNVDINKFTKDSLLNDILEMTKPKYKENIRKLKKVVYDKMSTGMKDAVENIENLIKYNKTFEFIRYDADNSEFTKSFYDVYLILFLVIYLSVKIIKILSKIILKMKFYDV